MLKDLCMNCTTNVNVSARKEMCESTWHLLLFSLTFLEHERVTCCVVILELTVM